MRHKDLRHYLMLRKLVENPWATVRFRKAKASSPEHIVRLRSGGRISLRPDCIDAHFFREVFVDDEYRLEQFGPQQLGCVLDLGGNIGIFTARVASLAKRVVVYEPIAGNFERLQRHVGGLRNVVACQEAVTGEAGTVRLYHPQDPRNPGTYSGYTDVPDAAYDEVPAVTLDEVLERHAIEHCDLLKVDVEGHEYAILHAASDGTLARIERIHGEYHDRWPADPRTRIANFRTFLEGKGYRVEIVPQRKQVNIGLFFATR